MLNWDAYPNFSKAEFDCKETGDNAMQPHFLERLQALRTEYGKPMRITSGYRSPKHSIEVRKVKPGYHAKGIACDVGCHSDDAFDIVKLALKHGFTGIGVSQNKRGARFIHLDLRTETPIIFSY